MINAVGHPKMTQPLIGLEGRQLTPFAAKNDVAVSNRRERCCRKIKCFLKAWQCGPGIIESRPQGNVENNRNWEEQDPNHCDHGGLASLVVGRCFSIHLKVCNPIDMNSAWIATVAEIRQAATLNWISMVAPLSLVGGLLVCFLALTLRWLGAFFTRQGHKGHDRAASAQSNVRYRG
jgi:hypothetical protein